MTRLEDSRQAFIQSIETDYPAFDRDGAFKDSVRMESAVKAFRLACEAFASELDQCRYAADKVLRNGLTYSAGYPITCIEDMVANGIDALTWDIRGEALYFLHEASKGEK